MAKSRYWRYVGGGLIVVAACTAWTLRQHSRQPAGVQPATDSSVPVGRRPVGCLGRFEPEDGVVRVAAPYYQSRPSVVSQLAVREGDWVRASQVIAYLDGKPQVEAERTRVASQLELARAQVEQVRAGAKRSDIEAQRAEIARLEADYRQQESDFKRYQMLARSSVVSAADLETRSTAFDTAGRAVDEARHRLAAMSEVREQDVRVAEAQLDVAQAQLREVEAQLAGLTVRAPSAGRVVKLHTRTGEQAGPEGILEIANTTRMAVEAEVYAADIAAVCLGQHAVIEIEDGGAKLKGVVTRVGDRVQQAGVLPGDPTSYSDAHVVPVHIQVAGCGDGNCPINARVKVTIEPAR